MAEEDKKEDLQKSNAQANQLPVSGRKVILCMVRETFFVYIIFILKSSVEHTAKAMKLLT